MREFLTQISPLNQGRPDHKPIFVVQGQNDPRVPLHGVGADGRAVRKHGGPVWYLMAKDEGHGFAKKKNQDFQFYSTVAFMQEFLLK